LLLSCWNLTIEKCTNILCKDFCTRLYVSQLPSKQINAKYLLVWVKSSIELLSQNCKVLVKYLKRRSFLGKNCAYYEYYVVQVLTQVLVTIQAHNKIFEINLLETTIVFFDRSVMTKMVVVSFSWKTFTISSRLNLLSICYSNS